MGERVAHLVTGQLLDFIELDDGFAIAKVRPPKDTVGRSLADVALRQRFGVTVVAVKHDGEEATPARPETVLQPGDLLIVSGPTAKVERLGSRAT